MESKELTAMGELIKELTPSDHASELYKEVADMFIERIKDKYLPLEAQQLAVEFQRGYKIGINSK